LRIDANKPNGVPRDLMQAARIQPLGWRAAIRLDQRLRDAYAWFVSNFEKARPC